ncbi:hypothetical protein ACUXV3_11770 [Roseobacteraceae bacterium NS-SX3]
MKLAYLTAALAALAAGNAAHAGESHAARHAEPLLSEAKDGIAPDTDIRSVHASRNGGHVTFRMETGGQAGSTVPAATGALGGAGVQAYVWPLSLDPSAAGFEAGSGTLALVATAHPDFDDTPLFDENGDGDLANDGAGWHSHWVVLTPNDGCGEGMLSVKDIPEGAAPVLPVTWPGLPIYIDSPGYSPVLNGKEVSLTVPLPAEALAFDGVTAGLQVNANVHAPLLCVTDVFDIASGDLSLPGKLE